jgi:hypothetical protein
LFDGNTMVNELFGANAGILIWRLWVLNPLDK